MIEFKKYEAKNNWEELGTVKSIAGKGGSVSFIKQNWKNSAKNVAVIIEKKDGSSAVIACHKDLSSKLRSGAVNIKQLLGLTVIEGPDDIKLIVLPGTGGTQKFGVDNISVETIEEESAEFLPEELVAF